MATLPRKYYSTSFAEMDTIPLSEGNIIVTYDTNGIYYDMGNPAGSGENVTRRKSDGFEFVDSLPEDRPEPTTVFIVKTGSGTDASGITYDEYTGYLWNLSTAEYQEIFTNARDFKVKTSPSTGKMYLTGSPTATETVNTLLKNTNIYVTASGDKIHADVEGNADTAGLATKAINDNATSPKPITGYLNSVSSDFSGTGAGTTITFIKGDGTSTSVQTQDTTYTQFSSSAPGLVPKPTGTLSNLVLGGNGWEDRSGITVGKATKDGNGQTIASTYIKDATFNSTTSKLTFTYGDSTTSTAHTKDVTLAYPTFDVNKDGAVPGPTSGDTGKFLRGDGTWVDVSGSGTSTDFTPATATSAGAHGLVPAPAAGTQNKVLTGGGTWLGTFSTLSNGLVPSPSSSDDTLSLRADGTWKSSGDGSTSTGSTAKNNTKLWVIGAETIASGATTNSNGSVYIGTDNKLYQKAGSASAQVVDISSTQALVNKTYEGMTLGTAAAATVATTIVSSEPNKLPTSSAVTSYVAGAVTSAANRFYSISVVVPTVEEGALAEMTVNGVTDATGTSVGWNIFLGTSPLLPASLFLDIAGTNPAHKWYPCTSIDFQSTTKCEITFTHVSQYYASVPNEVIGIRTEEFKITITGSGSSATAVGAYSYKIFEFHN